MSFTLSDLQRRLANIIRVGVVDELDDAAARVRVKSGGITTTWLPWLTTRAGEDRTYWAPEPGEQVLLLAPSGELAQAVVMPAIFRSAHGATSDSRETSRTVFKDGAVQEYNREAHQYLLDVPAGGSITLKIGQTTLLLEDSKATLTTPELLVDSPQSTFTGQVLVQGLLTYVAGMAGSGGGGATAAIQGNIAVTGGDVTADDISLKQHKHTEQGDGSPTSPSIP